MSLYDKVKTYRDEGLSWTEIVNRVHTIRRFDNGEALRGWFRRERSRTSAADPQLGPKLYSDTMLPPALAKPFEDVLQLDISEGEYVVILADLHVPYHHEEFIAQAVAHPHKDDKLKAIIVAGDLFTFDQLSKYSKAHNMPRMETELEIGGAMLLYLAQHAPVYITNSNHDARFANKIDVQFSLKRLMNAALNGRKPKNFITTTERDYLFVNDDFIIGHLTNASGISGKIAHNIAQKYQRHCLAGHDHIVGVYNPRARYIGASIGCSADFTKFWYSEKGMNPTRFMQRGYAVVTGRSEIELIDQDLVTYYRRQRDGDMYYTFIADRT